MSNDLVMSLGAILPLIVLFTWACLLLLVDVFLSRTSSAEGGKGSLPAGRLRLAGDFGFCHPQDRQPLSGLAVWSW